jgi:hypothetical protein
MIADAEKIVRDTVNIFFNSEIQKKNFLKIKEYLDEEKYRSIHRSFLTPLDIKINKEDFIKEIQEYSTNFCQWGNEHTHLPRYGIALVNQDGILKADDPINGSLYEWNKNNPDDPILETDCRSLTEIMYRSSLKPLSIFDGHWCRSNILKWDKSAEFKPHIDTIIPSPWIRLWATFDKDIVLEYHNGDSTVPVTDIEEGRVYLIDTSLVHYARAEIDQTYQLFLSVLPSAYDLIKENLYEQN